MNRAAVFCTSRIDLGPERYRDWVDYYVPFFAGESVDLWMFNDGPEVDELDRDDSPVEVRAFKTRLGRATTEVFPGWKRSFHAALDLLTRTYAYVAHVESDCYLLPSGRDEFLWRLFGAGYWTGWCPLFAFPETALQVVNDADVRAYFLERYAGGANLDEALVFESEVVLGLRPRYMLRGDRVESKLERLPPGLQYLAQATADDVRRYTREIR